MSRVITFSRKYPSYHPRVGEPTFFVEQIYMGLGIRIPELSMLLDINDKSKKDLVKEFHEELYRCSGHNAKIHTIRAGERWKVGDMFSPRVWSDVPYYSKQIIIWPDLQLKQVYKFHQDKDAIYKLDGKFLAARNYGRLAENDGLDEKDLFRWLMPNPDKPVEMNGQLLCWDDKKLRY